jgi:EAL domain-containing protein (putative c-di-GMP-specific phosphodiesterase class I)/GGDEF domain-containing protein
MPLTQRNQALEAGGAVRDPLTGLATISQAAETLKSWQATASQAQAMLIALGEMGALNLAFGPAVGDSVLCETARRIALFADDEFAGQTCLVARVDGSTFLVAVQEEWARDRWQWLAEALADAIALPFRDGDDAASIRLWPRIILARSGPMDGAGSLLDKLAEASDRSRELGAARIGWAQGAPTQFGAGRRQLEHDLLSAIDRDEIAVCYQSQYALPDDRLIGAEALARWNHPEFGQLGASTLFNIAARIDHVAHLSRHIIARAFAEAAVWPEALRLSVNVTASCLSVAEFGQETTMLARDNGFGLHNLTVEITEQALIGDMTLAQATLTRLADQGVRIALDDFGAGFCNFRYLKLLPLSLIKLDRSMIDGILEDPRDLSVFRAIVALARALDIKVVVEGVENEEQRAMITAEGCDSYQGFLRSAPVTQAEFLKLTGTR